MLSMVPINNLALSTLSPDKMKGGSGLFNLMRNLGGAMGLAVINTILTNRGELHYARLSEAITWSSSEAMRQLNMMATNLTARGYDGQAGALVQMAGRLKTQATVMSFIDIFVLISVLFAGLALASLLMRKPGKGVSGAAH